MKYFINFYLEGNKVQKPSDGISSGKWKLVDEETITPQYSLPEVIITGEHPIWSLPGYKGKQDKYKNFTKRDKDLIWRNTLEHNKRGVQYMKWAAPLAASPVFLMTGAAGATGNAILNLGRSIITHPLRTAAEFVSAGVAGNAVDKTVLRTTGDENFGSMVGRVTNTPELNGLWQFGNPGYLAGGFAGNITHRLATTGMERVSPIINEHIPSIISSSRPMLQPAYVGGVPGTMRTPWTLYEPTTGNYSQMNILDRTKAAIKAYKEHGKPSANTPTTTTEIEEGILDDIRQIGNRRKRVKVKGPDLINTSYTLDGKPIDKSKLSIELKPTSDGHIVEEVIPGQQVYAYEGKPVNRNNVQLKNWFRHEGKYRQESDIQTQTNITGSRIKPSEEVPEGSQFLDKKGNWKPLNDKMFRTAAGKGPNSWIYYDGTPIEWYKNPGFYHRIGALGTLTTLAIGAPNIIKTIKGAAEGTFTGNGIIPGVVNEYTGKNPQQTNDTTPENTPTNTPQTPDTTGRAERMAQRRKELGITE